MAWITVANGAIVDEHAYLEDPDFYGPRMSPRLLEAKRECAEVAEYLWQLERDQGRQRRLADAALARADELEAGHDAFWRGYTGGTP